jgi:chloramphenicol-sensitive protein RarD
MWGLFPLYFALLAGVGAVEVVAHRVVWSLAFCLVAMVVLAAAGRGGAWRALRRLTRRQVALLTAAAAVLSVNWGIFVYAVESGQVVQSSLGYFTNPLVSVVLGVLVLGERLRRVQWAAVAVAALAVIVLTVEDGELPWIALTLALSFGAYGLLKNRVGRGVGALPGMTVETAVLLVPALIVLGWLGVTGQGEFGGSAGQSLLLIGSGPVTAIALLIFAGAARRIRLSTLGLIQYVTPVMHLLVGLLVFGETMSAGRWAGFALIWLALVLLSADSLTAVRRRRAPASMIATRDRRFRFGASRT